MPTEHGGWGLTLEPVALGLAIAWSPAGLVLGLGAFVAFLVRTPLKLVAIDVRRGRWLDRSRLALRIAIAELVVLVSAGAVAVALAGWSWLAPAVLAGPLVAIQLSFDIRSRSRRLLPELCGALGVTAASASIVLAAGGNAGLAGGVWLVLAARALGAIPFVRVQIMRLHRGQVPVWQSDLAQVFGIAVATAAMFADRRLLLGLVGVVVLAVLQIVWVRRPPMPAKSVGMRQMSMGLTLATITALGVVW
jgi:hypothetical protein